MAATPEQAKCAEQLKEWIIRQPHLPNNLDDNLILRFVHSCYYDLDKAKKTVDLFFTVRGTCSDLISNRDPKSPHMQKIFKTINVAKYTTSGNKMIWTHQINDPGLENYDYILDAKLFFLCTDARFLDGGSLPEEDIVLIDVKDLTMRFLTKINLSAARRLSKYQEDAIPIRLKQVHVVNAPSFIDKIFGVVKPFLKKEITELIHFHPPKSETLYKYLSKEDLPTDFGGTQPSIAETMEETISLIMKHRDQLIDENLWRLVDKKKNGGPVDVASFRSLAID